MIHPFRRGGPDGFGFVLPAVLFGLLVLTALAHALLSVATVQRLAADAEWEVLRVRTAARSGIRAWVAHVGRDELPPAPGWSNAVVRHTLVPGAGEVPVRAARIDAEWIWVEATVQPNVANADSGPRVGSGAGRVGARAGVAVPVWSLSPVARESAARATVEVGGVVSPESGAGVGPFGTRPPVVSLEPASVGPEGVPLLGRLGLSGLVERRNSTGTATDGSGEGATVRVLVGPARIGNDTLRGVVAVDGDLTLGSHSRVEGVVLVGGTMRVEGSATVRGHARITDGLIVEAGGSVEGSPAVVRRILGELPELSRPLVPAGSSWIPTF